jgi:hypothetical protein
LKTECSDVAYVRDEETEQTLQKPIARQNQKYVTHKREEQTKRDSDFIKPERRVRSERHEDDQKYRERFEEINPSTPLRVLSKDSEQRTGGY